MDPVSWAGHLGIWNRGADPFAADYPLYAQMPHQALYGTTCYRYPLAIHLLPDLIRTVDLQMRLPDPLNLQQEHRVPLVNGDLKLTHFSFEQRFKTDTPPILILRGGSASEGRLKAASKG